MPQKTAKKSPRLLRPPGARRSKAPKTNAAPKTNGVRPCRRWPQMHAAEA